MRCQSIGFASKIIHRDAFSGILSWYHRYDIHNEGYWLVFLINKKRPRAAAES
jgi:hypothetical protein